MAKLSNDDSSWRAYGLKKKYETLAEDAQVPKPGKRKKNTKRWCKGVEGREHVVRTVRIVEYNQYCNDPYLKDDTGKRVLDENGRLIRKYCGHWRHHETKCINCGMNSYSLSKKAKAQADPELAGQLALEEKWCGEGHLWDWEEFNLTEHNKKRREQKLYFRSSDELVVRDGDYMVKSWRDTWISAKIRVKQYCVMCGKKSGKTKRIYPEDWNA